MAATIACDKDGESMEVVCCMHGYREQQQEKKAQLPILTASHASDTRSASFELFTVLLQRLHTVFSYHDTSELTSLFSTTVSSFSFPSSARSVPRSEKGKQSAEVTDIDAGCIRQVLRLLSHCGQFAILWHSLHFDVITHGRSHDVL